jgi:hypothetical protein
MSHYAKVQNGRVVQVIVAEQEFFTTFVDSSPGEWIQTSYNTKGNQHLLGGTPLRGNFAGVGDIYDQEHDVFYTPKPFEGWLLNPTTWTWGPPHEPPDEPGPYYWDNHAQDWVKIS